MDELRNSINIAGANISYGVPGGPGGQEKPVVFSIRGEDINRLIKYCK